MTPELSNWSSFYTLTGSCAGGLIGLQFVVITLIADKRIAADETSSAAFLTPTIVHFSSVLLLSLLVIMPWQELRIVSALWTKSMSRMKENAIRKLNKNRMKTKAALAHPNR